MGLSELTYKAVLSAIVEFDTKGKKDFLEEYGFHDSLHYFLVYKAHEYPSKAIAGVAHKYVKSGYKPLLAFEFNGGKNTVKKKLKSLGFDVLYR